MVRRPPMPGVCSMQEIQGHLEELYGTDISPELISTVTDAVMDEVRSWQNRPLEGHFPIIYLDALRVKTCARRPG